MYARSSPPMGARVSCCQTPPLHHGSVGQWGRITPESHWKCAHWNMRRNSQHLLSSHPPPSPDSCFEGPDNLIFKYKLGSAITLSARCCRIHPKLYGKATVNPRMLHWHSNVPLEFVMEMAMQCNTNPHSCILPPILYQEKVGEAELRAKQSKRPGKPGVRVEPGRWQIKLPLSHEASWVLGPLTLFSISTTLFP